MDAVPFIPSFLEWYCVISVFSSALVLFFVTSTGRSESTVSRRRRVSLAKTGSRPVGVAGHRGGESISSSPPHIQRRQSRARLKRISHYTRMENDARLRLYAERRRVDVMKGEK